ncbi:MAG: cell division protein SepF [Aurantimicrobium sp.]|jgi:cell division inhibitor SepF|uniref:Cell division protein SepF n=1 Tax=Aurantimicrobium photophilum TaxID=1987356 RepID=A0A2Z3RZA0_9MICO|nr:MULTISPECIES: cell division protein SepF [Aurantimicrobium]AWR21266.1 Cell division protein SepF [Aurantimicrobium photophilum]MDF9809288.1 cell division inhibitor SepF [Aurantimicrobium minutum]MDH6208210.1 cell division inhibitor SepF [Aurantimicrobium minutum]MDH6255195.1 cell division inhibitor SepF [Aurantimicrobium minutum]MDH6409326.1 cell division inhibitor SepF [Aurantimicrobium minutum]
MSNPLKKTMVYLGLADEDTSYDAPAYAAAPQVAPVSAGRAQVTPLRRNTAKNQAASDMNEIVTVHPKQYSDAKVIAENFREGVPVIMNLSQMTETDARRLIDFASGLSQGLFGKIERVTSKVFLLSPAHVAVSGDAAAETAEVDTTFFGE